MKLTMAGLFEPLTTRQATLEANVLAGGLMMPTGPAVLFWPRKEGSTTFGPCKLMRVDADGKRTTCIRDFRDQFEPVVLALAELLEVRLERK